MRLSLLEKRPTMTTEWNAESYHRVSDPQFRWGLRVLDRLALAGGERVLDAGCGSGRLSAVLLERLPSGHLIALDRSREMLARARATLSPRQGQHVDLVLADLARLPLAGGLDHVFSTATFHWVRDHEALFAGIFGALRPGGRLVAQCGGAGNLARLHAHAEAAMRAPAWRDAFRGWDGPWEFASPATTAARLDAAGFVDVRAWIEDAPTSFADEGAFAEFVSTVVLRLHLERLPAAERPTFVREVTRLSAADRPALTLDYVRLNIEARRPGGAA